MWWLRRQNEEDGFAVPPETLLEPLLEGYLAEGSVGRTVMLEKTPVLCGGIVNLGWRRGEAWVYHTKEFRKHLKSLYKILREEFYYMAKIGSFRRVQALVFYGNGVLLEHLKFEWEGRMRCVGPNGEDAELFARIFDGV